MATITYTSTISGTGVTTITNTIQWTLQEKLEEKIVINSADDPVTINYSRVENVKIISFSSASEFIVELTISGNVVEFKGTYFTFSCDLLGEFISNLSLIRISTDSTTDITINSNVYGESL